MIFLLLIFLIVIFILLKKKKLFYGVNEYNKLKILEENWKLIRNEIPDIDVNDKRIYTRNRKIWHNYDHNKLKKIDYWVRSWEDNYEWFNYGLFMHGKILGDAEIKFPNTIRILKQINKFYKINIAGFSLFMPNFKLPYHIDDNDKLSITVNQLLTGNDSYLSIKHNNKIHTKKHELGKVIVFNDSVMHSASNNDSKQNRVILYLNVNLKNT